MWEMFWLGAGVGIGVLILAEAVMLGIWAWPIWRESVGVRDRAAEAELRRAR